jgi:hypothetical protein
VTRPRAKKKQKRNWILPILQSLALTIFLPLPFVSTAPQGPAAPPLWRRRSPARRRRMRASYPPDTWSWPPRLRGLRNTGLLLPRDKQAYWSESRGTPGRTGLCPSAASPSVLRRRWSSPILSPCGSEPRHCATVHAKSGFEVPLYHHLDFRSLRWHLFPGRPTSASIGNSLLPSPKMLIVLARNYPIDWFEPVSTQTWVCRTELSLIFLLILVREWRIDQEMDGF